MLRLCQIWSILLGFAVTGMSVGVWADDGYAAAPSFAEFCRGDIGADKVAIFNAELDRADRAIAAGNQETAETALRDAAQAVWRGGAYDESSVRCLGEPATRRWFNTQLWIWRQGWGSPPEGRASGYDAIYVVAADRGADGVVEVISYRPADRFAASYHAVENITEVAEARQHYGTFQLPEEIAIAQACDDALGLLQDYAKREHAKTLEAEDAAFNRPATQMEKDAIQKLGSIGGLAQAIAGVDIDTTDRAEALVVRRQVDESNALLDVARGFEIESVFGDSNQRPPSFLRAEPRGDTSARHGTPCR